MGDRAAYYTHTETEEYEWTWWLPSVRREETFLPDGTAPGTVLQINDEPCFYYSADSLKHSTAASSVVLAICFAFPILKRQFFFPFFSPVV